MNIHLIIKHFVNKVLMAHIKRIESLTIYEIVYIFIWRAVKSSGVDKSTHVSSFISSEYLNKYSLHKKGYYKLDIVLNLNNKCPMCRNF